jgi:hypothetical protein
LRFKFAELLAECPAQAIAPALERQEMIAEFLQFVTAERGERLLGCSRWGRMGVAEPLKEFAGPAELGVALVRHFRDVQRGRRARWACTWLRHAEQDDRILNGVN